MEQARITADPSYYERAQGALDRSMQVQPAANAEAMIGLGALANARHDFAAARDWAVQARELQPSTAAVYGVLADALTQLGDAEGATAAVQQMLDIRPGIASFSRASYDLELHGRVDDVALRQGRAKVAARHERGRSHLPGGGPCLRHRAVREVARTVSATVDGEALRFTVHSAAVSYPAGQGGLPTIRLVCELTAPAELDRPAEVTFTDGFGVGRIGWREITATGVGVSLPGSPVRPAASATSCGPTRRTCWPTRSRFGT